MSTTGANSLYGATTTNNTTINAVLGEVVEVKDNILSYAAGNGQSATDSNNIGFTMEYPGGGVVKWAGILRQATDGVFRFVKDQTTQPGTSTDLTTATKASIHIAALTGTSASFTNNTNQLILGTTNTTSITMSNLTGNRSFKLPDADSNSVRPDTATANQWVTNIDNTGVQNKSQPAFSNISGTVAVSQGGTNSGTALNNGKLMISSGGAIVEGTSNTTPSFTSATLTAASNQLTIQPNGSGNFFNITATNPATSRLYTIPDVLGDGSFVLTSGFQILAGKQFSGTAEFVAANPIQLKPSGSGQGVYLTCTAFMSTNRTVTIPDPLASANVLVSTLTNGGTQSTSNTTNITINAPSGYWQSFGSYTLAAGAVDTEFKLLNSFITTSSRVFMQVDTYSGTFGTNGIPYISCNSTGLTGEVKIRVANIGTSALSGNVVFKFLVL